MDIAKNITQAKKIIARAKRARKTIGLVPTMGALHAGHRALVRAANSQCDFIAVSIFINHMQFGRGEDYTHYPRTLEKDITLLKKEKVDLLFCPKRQLMYPANFSSLVNEESLSRGLCGATRPGHFKGVCTVVAKLFHIIEPNIAYFGQKDFQQAAIIARMVRNLNFAIKIKIFPTIRESDGLALSSRNRYLNPRERLQASTIYHALCYAKKLIEQGERRPAKIVTLMKKMIMSKTTQIDYLSIVDPETLHPCRLIRKKTLIAIAARIGNTRLIDNILIHT